MKINCSTKDQCFWSYLGLPLAIVPLMLIIDGKCGVENRERWSIEEQGNGYEDLSQIHRCLVKLLFPSDGYDG